MPADRFAAEYLEREVLLVRGAMPQPRFGWADLDDWLHRIEPTAPAIQLFKQGLVPEDAYTDQTLEFGAPRQRLNKQRFFSLLNGGATLVVNRLENHSRRIGGICAEVGRFTACGTVSNAYLSFGGGGTFGRHWDTHDVFAIQLLGRKRWRVYAPTFDLPLPMHSSEGMQCPAVPLVDCVLETGDLLYVPRGWWHEAIPFDEPSLHVSVGTYGPSVHDYVSWVCAQRLGGAIEARRLLADAADAESLAAVIRKLGALVADDANRAEFEQLVASRERQTSDFNTELFFSSGPEGLRGSAAVKLTSFRAPRIESGELRTGAGRLRLNATCLAIVNELAATDELSLDALCARVAGEAPEAVRLAVLDLALHDVVSISQH